MAKVIMRYELMGHFGYLSRKIENLHSNQHLIGSRSFNSRGNLVGCPTPISMILDL